MPALVSSRPVLLAPTAGRPADASLTTFSWDAPRLDRLRFQLAADRHFTTLLWDVPADDITQLTLQSALPKVDTTYYWRVGRDRVWSAPAAFRATTDEDVAAWEWARHEAKIRAARDAQRAREARAAAEAEVDAPYRTGHTSRREVLLWIYFLLAGFALAVLLLVGAWLR